MSKPTYRLSDGTRMTTEQIDRKTAEGIAEMFSCLQGDYHLFCNAGIQPDPYDWKTTKIDPSHTVSKKRCKEMGKSELCWDWENIEPMSRYAHELWENKQMNWERVKQFDNFSKMMSYIEKHDPEQYTKLMLLDEEKQRV